VVNCPVPSGEVARAGAVEPFDAAKCIDDHRRRARGDHDPEHPGSRDASPSRDPVCKNGREIVTRSPRQGLRGSEGRDNGWPIGGDLSQIAVCPIGLFVRQDWSPSVFSTPTSSQADGLAVEPQPGD
jgi:hypothetical protein